MPAGPPQEVTQLLLAWNAGDETALEQLIPLVYNELRHLAHRCLRGENSSVALQSTELVHEAYTRLIDFERVRWQDRAHFFAISAQVMRRILVDLARSRHRLKRGGAVFQVSLDEGAVVAAETSAEIAALDDALSALAKLDSRKGHVVELRFFGGLSIKETAEVLKVSADTVQRDWKLAKVWLLRELSRGVGYGA
jgi:RNA polymerase sigma factor (TIGR02999 family)